MKILKPNLPKGSTAICTFCDKKAVAVTEVVTAKETWYLCPGHLRDFNKEDMMIIWQCNAHNKTINNAVHEFCETYWDKPRKYSRVDSNGQFRLRGGLSLYCCSLEGDVYQITRTQEA